jgi:hypothetical protein
MRRFVAETNEEFKELTTHVGYKAVARMLQNDPQGELSKKVLQALKWSQWLDTVNARIVRDLKRR